MALLLSDENFRLPVMRVLRALGHDVVTVQDAGLDNQGLADSAILAEATAQNRIVLTHDRDYIYLHAASTSHAGIVFRKNDSDTVRLAQRIDDPLTANPNMAGQLIRVYRPARKAP